MIGFETIGNATITVFDDKPILVTDPWVSGNPYFGSWGPNYQNMDYQKPKDLLQVLVYHQKL